MNCLLFHAYTLAITCPFLSDLVNGSLTYSGVGDQNSSYAFNVVATYSCNTGFSLVGNSNRTCTGDGNSTTGAFSGIDPNCEGKVRAIAINVSHILILYHNCSHHLCFVKQSYQWFCDVQWCG